MTPLALQIAAGLTVFAVTLGLLARLWRAIDIDARKDREAKLIQAREFVRKKAWERQMRSYQDRIDARRAKHQPIRDIVQEREAFTRGWLERVRQ